MSTTLGTTVPSDAPTGTSSEAVNRASDILALAALGEAAQPPVRLARGRVAKPLM